MRKGKVTEGMKKGTLKGDKIRIVIIAIGTVLILLLIVFIALYGSKKNNNLVDDNVGDNGAYSSEDANNIVEDEKMKKIETSYIALEYPEKWMDYLTCEETVTENGVVEEAFYYSYGEQKIELFAIYFGDAGTGNFLGEWKGKKESIAVSVEVYELAAAETLGKEEQTIVYAMAEAVNVVVQSIEKAEGFTAAEQINVVLGSRDAELLQIETPYCTLGYPSYWRDYLRYQKEFDGEEKKVAFYYEQGSQQIELFSIYFNTLETGDLIGYIEKDNLKTAVSVELADTVLDDTWAEKDANIIYAMQECVNDVIQSIVVSEGYKEE